MDHYSAEKRRFADHYATLLPDASLESLLGKLAKRFETTAVAMHHDIKRYKNARRITLGTYTPNRALIRFRRGPVSLGTLCHEFAHHLAWTKYKCRDHGYRFRITCNEVYDFAMQWVIPLAALTEAMNQLGFVEHRGEKTHEKA